MGAGGGSHDWFCILVEPKLNNDANLQNSNKVAFAVSSILNMMRLLDVQRSKHIYSLCVLYVNLVKSRFYS